MNGILKIVEVRANKEQGGNINLEQLPEWDGVH